MKNTNKWRGLTCFVLCCLLVLSPLSTLTLRAQGEMPVKKEIIYALLEETGAARKVIAVNYYTLPTAGEIVDYGNFSSVQRLTGDSELHYDKPELRAQAPAGVWYYQAVLEQSELPWLFEFAYSLDGKACSSKDLVGATGTIGLTIAVRKNPQAEPSFADSFLLQLSVALVNSNVSQVKAPGATVANAGLRTMYNYIFLPDSNTKAELEFEAQDFYMPAPQFAAIPLDFDVKTLGLSKDAKELPALPGLNKLTAAVSELNGGAQKLAEGSQAVAEGLTELATGAGELQANSSALSQGASDFKAGFQEYQTGLGQYLAGVKTLAPALQELNTGGQELIKAVGSLSTEASKLEEGYGQIDAGLQELQQGLAQSAAGLAPPAELQAELAAYLEQLSQLETSLTALEAMQNFDFSALLQAVQVLSNLPLPSPQEQELLGNFAQNLALEQAASGSLELSLAILQGYAKEIPFDKQAHYLANLQSLNNAIREKFQAVAALLGSFAQLSPLLQNFKSIKGEQLATVQTALLSLEAAQTKLGPQLPQLKQTLRSCQEQIRALAVADSKQDMQAAQAQIQAVVGQLSQGSAEFLVGLKQFAAGLNTVQQGFTLPSPSPTGAEQASFGTALSQLAEAGTKLQSEADTLLNGSGELGTAADKLASGVTAYVEGGEQVATGLDSLNSQYGEFNQGVQDLAVGTQEFQEESSKINAGFAGELDDLVRELMPKYEAKSFIDSRNTNVSAVQFIILGVEVPELSSVDNKAEAEAEESDFWSRLRGIFSFTD